MGLIPGSRRSPRVGYGNQYQYSCLENSINRGARWLQFMEWQSQTQLSIHSHTEFGPYYTIGMEKEMATHSSVLAWRIPEMAEPDGLPSMGSHRDGHD